MRASSLCFLTPRLSLELFLVCRIPGGHSPASLHAQARESIRKTIRYRVVLLLPWRLAFQLLIHHRN
ncbi:hypothetical protein TREES_T100007412 [Tupaia chinensis]|uniref:Uncharacterized protein n=1 Tax=Tupaia chinensis TaxID=246437 RepID=L9KZV0_TUPCH|nr:hypothetical protein TREES_T100007412 [Tupaia chinensis]